MKYILWAIYIALLAVLFPHTAWTFSQFEQPGSEWVGLVAAFAFEAAIAAFTWRLKQLIETTPNYKAGIVWLRKFSYRYLNPYGIGLFAALIISAVANWAHAVEFGKVFRVFGEYSVSPTIFSVAFGAILPVISLLFARVLAEATGSEEEANPELERAKETNAELRKHLKANEAERFAAEHRAVEAERRFAAIGDLVVRLFADEKRQRILAARELWPELPAAALTIVAKASPSYVSEVLNDGDESRGHGAASQSQSETGDIANETDQGIR